MIIWQIRLPSVVAGMMIVVDRDVLSLYKYRSCLEHLRLARPQLSWTMFDKPPGRIPGLPEKADQANERVAGCIPRRSRPSTIFASNIHLLNPACTAHKDPRLRTSQTARRQKDLILEFMKYHETRVENGAPRLRRVGEVAFYLFSPSLPPAVSCQDSARLPS